MASCMEISRVILNLICHIFVGIVVYYVWSSALRADYSGSYWVHAAMMVLAIPFCFAEGLLVFDLSNYTNLCSERTNQILHIIWFLSGGIFTIVGGIFGFIDHDKEKIWRAHGIIGMVGVVTIVVSFVFGCILLCGRGGDSKKFSRIHWIAGLVGYIVCMIAFLIVNHTVEAIILILGITIISLITPIILLLTGQLR